LRKQNERKLIIAIIINLDKGIILIIVIHDKIPSNQEEVMVVMVILNQTLEAKTFLQKIADELVKTNLSLLREAKYNN
jgi:hypothetical protein